mgnify:CR=1 FL=1
MTKEALINKAHKDGKITKRQFTAMMRHQAHHSSPHIAHMLKNMEHMTCAKAHKAAKKETGE